MILFFFNQFLYPNYYALYIITQQYQKYKVYMSNPDINNLKVNKQPAQSGLNAKQLDSDPELEPDSESIKNQSHRNLITKNNHYLQHQDTQNPQHQDTQDNNSSQKKAPASTPKKLIRKRSSMSITNTTGKAKSNSWYTMITRYATTREKWYLLVGSLFSAAQGVLFPTITLFLGNAADKLTPNNPGDEIYDMTSKTALMAFIFGNLIFVCATIGMFLWTKIGRKINERVRLMLFKALLKQDVSWYDNSDPEKLTGSYIEDTSSFYNALGEKNHTLIYTWCTFFSGISIGLIKGIAFTGVVTAFFPMVLITLVVVMIFGAKLAEKVKVFYEEAQGYSEEALQGIKTVHSLNGQKHESEKYEESILSAERCNVKESWKVSFSFGILFCTIFLMYGLGYKVGSIFIEKNVYNFNSGNDYVMSDIITIYFSVITGAFAFGQIQPSIVAINKGKFSSFNIFEIIEHEPEILSNDSEKIVPKVIKGEIELKNVCFNYPSRPTIRVLSDLS